MPQTPQDKSRYVKKSESITRDPRLIQKNPGRKTTAKLLLNSFWGKCGEILLKPSTETVYNASHLFALVSNPFNDIRQVRIPNDDSPEVALAALANLKDRKTDNGCVNIFVAALTTCHARLQQRVLYFDTDSVIYTTKPSQPNTLLGNYRGEMTINRRGKNSVRNLR